jgi:hypothetical protein
MATPESGVGGSVVIGSTTIGEVLKWSLTKTAHTTRFGSSSSGGYKKTIAGTKQASGSIEMKLDTAAASPVLEGSSVTLLLKCDGTVKYTMPAVINSFAVSVDIDNGEVISQSVNFESNGAWTEIF